MGAKAEPKQYFLTGVQWNYLVLVRCQFQQHGAITTTDLSKTLKGIKDDRYKKKIL